MAQTILVVEDETAVRQMIAFSLSRAGFEVQEAGDVAAARSCIADSRPDLVLVDWMLPDATGLELTRLLKRDAATSDLAVIMLTAMAEESSKIAGLDSGADDYITKPFSTRELLARINAVLRRAGGDAQSDQPVDFGVLSLRAEEHRLFAGEIELHLGPTEYKLVSFFMRNPGRAFSREQILDNVWGRNIYVEERTVDVHVQRLRKALSSCGAQSYVQTVRGTGYRFSVD